MHKGCGKELWSNRQKDDLIPMMFGELWSRKDWLGWWAETAVRVRQGSEHCTSKECCPFDMNAEVANYYAVLVCRNKLSRCHQCAQTDGKTVKTDVTVRHCGKQLSSSFHQGSNHGANTPFLAPDYCIHPGPWDPFPLLHDAFQASSCQSICLQQQLCWWWLVHSRLHQRSKDRFYNDFSKMLGFFRVLLWHHRGLGGASGLRLDHSEVTCEYW